MVGNLQLLLTAQYAAHFTAVAQAAIRIPHEAKIPVFQYLRPLITPYALRKILKHYRVMSDLSQMPPCTGIFTQTLGLPCAHLIRHAIDSKCPLEASSVHSHWHLKSLENPSAPLQYNAELFIQDPPIARPKGKPANPRPSRAKRSGQPANSTQREPSEFERVLRSAQTPYSRPKL